jgi:hypothetical protein
MNCDFNNLKMHYFLNNIEQGNIVACLFSNCIQSLTTILQHVDLSLHQRFETAL